MPSSSKSDLSRGNKRFDQVNLTFLTPRVEERDKPSGLSPVAVFVSDMEFDDGSAEELVWELAPVEWFNDRDSGQPRCYVEDGKLLDVDENNQYRISSTSEYGMLSESLEENGIAPSVMQRLLAEPELLKGVKIHGIQKPVPGRSYVATKGAKKGQTVEWTTLVADKILEDPNQDGKSNRGGKLNTKTTGTTTASKSAASSSAASKPTASASASAPASAKKPAGKPAPAPEPEEESTELSAVDEAAIEVVQLILSDPKANGVKTYSPRQNDGGVTVQQLTTAVVIAYKGKNPPKSEVNATVADPDWIEAMAEDADGNKRWEFDKDKGIVWSA